MRIFVSLFFVILFLFLCIFYLFYLKEHSTQELKLSKQIDLYLQDSALILQEELTRLNGDIFYITSLYNKKHTIKGAITNELLDFMHYKTNYKSLQVFDIKGAQHLHITSQNGVATLQKKSQDLDDTKKQFIQKALSLHEEEILISKIYTDTNSSQALFQIASPLFNIFEKKQGVVVFDVSLQGALEKLLLYTEQNRLKVFIANHNGAWIFTPTMQPSLPKNINQVMQKSPQLWEKIQENVATTINTNQNKYAFEFFNPLQNIQHHNILHKELQSATLKQGFSDKALQLTLLVQHPTDLVQSRVWQQLFKQSPYLIFGALLSFIFSFILLYLLRDRFRTLTQLRLAANYFEHAEDGMVITDPDTTIIKVNKRYTEISGFTEDQLLGQKTNILASGWTPKEIYKNMWDELHTNNYWQGEITDRRQNGSIHSQWLRIIVLRDKKNNIINFLGLSTDITEQKESQEIIKKLAYRDPLTGLANKVLFEDRLKKAIEIAKRYNKQTGLLFINLDNFKHINNGYGHYIGDIYLIEIAKRLKVSIRQSDTLARFGGDEFVILLEDYENTDIATLCQRILKDINEPLLLDQVEFSPSASIGIATFPDDAKDDRELLQNANLAMDKAKQSGKKSYCFYQTDRDTALHLRLHKENKLKEALLNKELYLHFQPQISLQEKKVVGVEALLRWNNPELGILPPEQFIHIAESIGLIVPFTQFVLTSACEAIKRFDAAGLHTLKVAVNISSIHLQSENFILNIEEIVVQNGIEPQRIELEFIEEAFLQDTQKSATKLERLKALGFTIAIDAFGTGYSSLAYLKKFYFNTLKIDRHLVQRLPTDLDDISIIKAIIAVTNALNIKLIAQGAETKENVDFLQQNQCDTLQGYFFSKPLELQECIEYIKNFSIPK